MTVEKFTSRNPDAAVAAQSAAGTVVVLEGTGGELDRTHIPPCASEDLLSDAVKAAIAAWPLAVGDVIRVIEGTPS
jgi:hypothetical protein